MIQGYLFIFVSYYNNYGWMNIFLMRIQQLLIYDFTLELL